MALQGSLWVSGVSPWAGNSRLQRGLFSVEVLSGTKGCSQPHPPIPSLIPITISIPIPSSMQSHQLRHPGKAVSPAHFTSSSFRQLPHTWCPSHPHPRPMHVRLGAGGLGAVSLFPAFLHPAPSQADLAGHCVKVQPSLSSHKFLQLLSPKSHHQEGWLDDLQEGCSQSCFVVRNCRHKGDSRERE